jgi:hypothetical protein
MVRLVYRVSLGVEFDRYATAQPRLTSLISESAMLAVILVLELVALNELGAGGEEIP